MIGFILGVLASFGGVAFLEYTDNSGWATAKSWVKKIPDPAGK